MRVERLFRGGLLVAAAAAACAPASPVVRAQPAAGVTGDAAIAGMVAAANDGEIMQARIALERATRDDVRTFAQRMITEHTTADEQLRRVLERMNMVEGASSLATQLDENADRTAEVLRSVDAAHFDRAYLDSQVSTHEWLLRTLDSTLIPAARSEVLKAQLRIIRATAVAHLERARRIRDRQEG